VSDPPEEPELSDVEEAVEEEPVELLLSPEPEGLDPLLSAPLLAAALSELVEDALSPDVEEGRLSVL
jgi:hypothetical protein